jgi:putative membrane protein insertion efficiency factor
MRQAAVIALRAYKYFVSPLLPPSCRFTPSCSEYAAEAISTYGIVKAQDWLFGG